MTPQLMSEGLGAEGKYLWDTVVARMGDKLVASDYTALRMTCKWVDRFADAIGSTEKGSDIRLGIACDKFLLLSAKFGLTPHDRKASGDDKPKEKTTKKRTSLDSLKPGELGSSGR